MKHQDGIISMITTIMVSILLIMMALGLLILTNGGTQQASDDELSLRAYAAAEGGLDWAFTHLGATAGNCTQGLAALAADPNALPGSLTDSNQNQIILPAGAFAGGQRLGSIRVRWIQAGDYGAKPGYGPWPGGALPAASGAVLPGVELTLVDYNSGGGASVNSPSPNYNVRNVVFLPSTSGAGNTPINTNVNGLYNTGPKILAQCQNPGSGLSTPYYCSATVSALASGPLPVNEGELVYIRGLYLPPGASTSYSLCFQTTASPGNCALIPLQTAYLPTARCQPPTSYPFSACLIASRRLPAPESLRLVTVNVAA